MEKNKKYTNALAREKSPYLLQHAHNPVNWHAWNEETLMKAKEENKLILVSIGYSACHWCHVMEHESFEDEDVAVIMNKYFINIKVDREEHPDVDAVYMSAVQLMTQHGGWPLNCFALPDGRPVYGGTYFPKQNWISVLQNIAGIWQNNKAKAEEYANELTNGMLHVEQLRLNEEEKKFSPHILQQAVKKWKTSFDLEKGGNNRAPKFPMPNNYLFLLRYAHFSNDNEVKKHVHHTLNCMANGGIYDHIGGGFSRYSTDMDWKVPHFEKMLYDNAQLVSLYAEAYSESKNELYKEVVYETLEFIQREMTSPENGFYSALDADSDGVEGKFYVWDEEELKGLIDENDFKIFSEVFSVNRTGYWENGNYILHRSKSVFDISSANSISEETLLKKISLWKKILLEKRSGRTRPGLDDKILASWNALMIKAYCDAYFVFGEKIFLDQAKRSALFFENNFFKKDGALFHAYKKGEAYINAFLEDYAFAIEAFLKLFSVSGEEKYADLSQKLCNYAFEKFYDPGSGMFYFTSSDDPELIIRKAEVSDNVIPASGSQMARNLFALYRLSGSVHHKLSAEKMLNNIKHELAAYPSGYSNWALLLLEILSNASEVAIVGKDVNEIIQSFRHYYLPNTIFVHSNRDSDFPLLKNRFVEGKNLIYICKNSSCSMPVETVKEALEQMN